jgi:RND family efflux transporter MFP subunit
MNDKSALLQSLRIDRDEPPPAPRRRYRLWTAAGIAALALLAALIGFARHSGGLPIRVSVAQKAATAGGGDSMLDASGYVVARRQATVSAKITGKVTEVLIEEGQHVKQGEIVARLDDTNIRAALNQSIAQLNFAQASLAQVNVNLANAQRDFERKQKLVQQNFISATDLDLSATALDNQRAQRVTAQRSVEVAQRGLEMAQRNVDDTVIRSPFAGVITVKAAQPGEIISPMSAGGGFTRTGIGTIVDMESLEVEVDVNENFINRVHPQQPATIKLNAYPDWEIPAYVIAIIPTADRSKATVKVRIGFKQKDSRVLPDMGARVSFLNESGPPTAAPRYASAVVLPSEAIVAQGDTGIIFVVRGNTLERRAVRLGSRTGGGQTVLSGVTAGERVAVGDLGALQDGIKVTIQE